MILCLERLSLCHRPVGNDAFISVKNALKWNGPNKARINFEKNAILELIISTLVKTVRFSIVTRIYLFFNCNHIV